MITHLNISRMPSRWFFLGLNQGHFGDVVIWLGRLYVSWNWGGAK